MRTFDNVTRFWRRRSRRQAAAQRRRFNGCASHWWSLAVLKPISFSVDRPRLLFLYATGRLLIKILNYHITKKLDCKATDFFDFIAPQKLSYRLSEFCFIKFLNVICFIFFYICLRSFFDLVFWRCWRSSATNRSAQQWLNFNRSAVFI